MAILVTGGAAGLAAAGGNMLLAEGLAGGVASAEIIAATTATASTTALAATTTVVSSTVTAATGGTVGGSVLATAGVLAGGPVFWTCLGIAALGAEINVEPTGLTQNDDLFNI